MGSSAFTGHSHHGGHHSGQVAPQRRHSRDDHEGAEGVGRLHSGISTKMKDRIRHPLQVVTRGERSFLRRLGRLNSGGNKRRIRWTHNVADLYALGLEVFPSTHPAMEVRHAMRLADQTRVVVKIREKKESFACPQEEKDWRTSTEFMMNIPKSGSIVELYDVLEDSKNYYVVMEKASGMDLFETLDCHGRLPMEDCKLIIRQLLFAIAELHERGCIHKDLKLENVMVDRAPMQSSSFHSGSSASAPQPVVSAAHPELSEGPLSPTASPPIVKLIDFDTVEPQGCQRRPQRQQTLSVVGTDQYIAQEAYAGKYSPASDIFAIGVIAYRLLAGKFPFKADIFDDEEGENWVGSPKMQQIRERLQSSHIDFNAKPFCAEPMARDLVKSMLAVDETERPQAAQALQHPWLAVQHARHPSCAETLLPKFSEVSEETVAHAQVEVRPVPTVDTDLDQAAFRSDAPSPPGSIDI